VVDLGLWGHEASSKTDDLWRSYVTSLEADEGRGNAEAGGHEVVWEANDPPLPTRCAYLRIKSQRHDGLATLHGTSWIERHGHGGCSVGGA
jgi:hypothetical protein